MKRLIRLFALLLWTVPTLTAAQKKSLASQDLGARPITLRDGLPDSRVEGIFFTGDGRLGMCTQAALCLYDGASFTTFPFPSRNQYYWMTSNIPHTEYVDSELRVWAKRRDVLYLFDLRTESYIANVDSVVRSYGVGELLNNMFVDETGRLWFVLASGKVQAWDPAAQTLITIDHSKMARCGQVVCINSNGSDCWLVYENGVIRCYNIDQQTFTAEDHSFEGQIAHDNQVLIRFFQNDFWLVWDRGVAFHETLLHRWTLPTLPPLSEIDMYTCLDVDSLGNAYVGSGQSGTFVFDNRTHQPVKQHLYELEDGSRAQYSDITDVLVNPKDGSVWTSFQFRGLCYYHPNCNRFETFSVSSGTRKTDQHEFARCFAATSDGTIYVGTNIGLYTFDKTNRTSKAVAQFNGQIINDMIVDKDDRLWIGTFYNGLYCYKNGQLKNYNKEGLTYKNYLSDNNINNIRRMAETGDGRLAIGIAGGLTLFDPQTGQYTFLKEKHPELTSYVYPTAIEKDKRGELYVGTTKGIFCYDPATDKVSFPFFDFKNGNAPRADEIYNDILCDSHGTVWLATCNGLYVLNPDDNTSFAITMAGGLPHRIVRSLMEDQEGNVWASTERGLCRIVLPKDGHPLVTSFQLSNGILLDGYYNRSRLRTGDGTLLFGGLGGLNFFQPQQLNEQFVFQHPVLRALHVNGVEVQPAQEYKGRVILQNALSYTEEVKLKYDENFLTIDFSALNFVNPEQTFYRYRLEGYEDDWHEVQAANDLGHATYTGLPSGHYRLVVYSAATSVSGEQQWCDTPAQLGIVIGKPFYATAWAKTIYALLFLALAWLIWHESTKRFRERMERMQQMRNRQQEEELNMMKFNFFNNISHEFRTPLTLVITPLESYLKRLDNQRDREQISSILRNARQLLQLVNQLLDFHKLERGGEKLHLDKNNLTEAAEQTTQSFRALAESRQLELTFSGTADREKMLFCFDHDKVRKILNNLLSNAIKYTPAGGEVHVETGLQGKNDMAFIRVSDTGVGIAQDDLPRVFERFYQAANKPANPAASNGVGLHLVLSYARLHGGDATVESQEGRGTTFTIFLPTNLTPEDVEQALPAITDTAEPAHEETPTPDDNVQEINEEETAETNGEKEAKTVLIVEDNIEFRHFLKDALYADYRVITACDGQEGEMKTLRDNPDIIITDVMMPVMNGLELCERLKTNLNTSHIPIILLTARSSDEVKVKGYKVGADSYISKPFSMEVLTTRIDQLLQQIEQRRQRYRRDVLATPESVAVTPVDEQFVQEALKAVEDNIDNVDYSVNDLADKLLITRTSLYRKMQGILGMTPKDFIRDIRLKRAAQLLNDSEMTVSEIAYKVGFSTPRYFSKVFLSTYGVLPSHYGTRARNDGDAEEEEEEE